MFANGDNDATGPEGSGKRWTSSKDKPGEKTDDTDLKAGIYKTGNKACGDPTVKAVHWRDLAPAWLPQWSHLEKNRSSITVSHNHCSSVLVLQGFFFVYKPCSIVTVS